MLKNPIYMTVMLLLCLVCTQAMAQDVPPPPSMVLPPPVDDVAPGSMGSGPAAEAVVVPPEAETGVRMPVADPTYEVQPEDVLRISVWGEPQMSNLDMPVTPDGKINIPYLGTMKVEGYTQAEIAKGISVALAQADIIYDAKVQVTVIQMHERLVYVVGEVNRPGGMPFKDGDTIADAIAVAGSYTQNAWLEEVKYTPKDSDVSYPVNVKKILEGDTTYNYKLNVGDRLYVPPRDYQEKFYVMGQVMRPNIYDLRDDTTVLTAINLAGGPTPRGSMRGTVVVRGEPGSQERIPVDMTAMLDKGDLTKNIVLESGDIVFVPETNSPDWSKISQLLSVVTSIGYIRRYGVF